MKFKNIMFVCMLLAILAIGAVNATDVNSTEDAIAQEDISIDNQADDTISQEDISIDNQAEDLSTTQQEDVLEADDGTFTSLKNKIDNAEVGSTVTLANDYKYDDGFTTDGVYINKDLTINGNGHTLNGLSKSRIFKIGSGVKVVLNNIKFSNGFANHGAAIKSEANLEINNCVFDGNEAEHNGWVAGDQYWSKYSGAVASGTIISDGNLKIKYSTFKNNNAEFYGGAINNFRGNLIIETVNS